MSMLTSCYLLKISHVDMLLSTEDRCVSYRHAVTNGRYLEFPSTIQIETCYNLLKKDVCMLMCCHLQAHVDMWLSTEGICAHIDILLSSEDSMLAFVAIY